MLMPDGRCSHGAALHAAAAAAAAGHGGRQQRRRATARATPAPTASDPRVRRADALNRWFSTIEHVPARARRRGLDHITSARHSGNPRLVTRATLTSAAGGTFATGRSSSRARPRTTRGINWETPCTSSSSSWSVTGAPGVPELLGAWREGEHVWYAVADGGLPLSGRPAGQGHQSHRAL